ncbi:MAG TPA: NAD(P)-dependent oxidoreductase [Acetobacteraceae bacterium]|jgi:D-3-phosphoglycerate dehydrogenase / 2-oxoglutarate reductase|nr:NAD(P)-dependent oxidoreductase [Acetobacteraceae bacterium]
MAANRKKVLLPQNMARAGWDLIATRDDVEAISYPPTLPASDFHRFLGEAHGIALSYTPYHAPELAASPAIEVVARIGVGYDSVGVAALTARRVPLLIAGTANSVSVAEHALFMMLQLAKRAAVLDPLVRAGRWHERYADMPVDLAGRTVLVIGFGRIGTRIAARCRAMDMSVLVYDPYVPQEAIEAAGCEPVSDLDAALPRADFLTVHCPKTAETAGMIDARRLALLRPSAFLVNTARGGIVDEAALAAALAEKLLAGAGVDVFATEPVREDNPLLKLSSVIVSPHMAGVTSESTARMAVAAVGNILSVFDGKPNRENVVNKEVLD